MAKSYVNAAVELLFLLLRLTGMDTLRALKKCDKGDYRIYHLQFKMYSSGDFPSMIEIDSV